jgi:RNA polymerase sigma-70 factor, ECF subfamily
MKASPATNESALISRILAGESELFHDLIRPYERLVYVTIFAILKNEAEAEDGAQETMISAFRQPGWLRRIRWMSRRKTARETLPRQC